jgi:hypothetical protein
VAVASQAQSPAGIAGRDSRERIAQTELLLQVDINRQGLQDATVIVQGAGGELLASADDLRKWRLHVPRVAPGTQRAGVLSAAYVAGSELSSRRHSTRRDIVTADHFRCPKLSARNGRIYAGDDHAVAWRLFQL